MTIIHLDEHRIEHLVDELFRQNPPRYGEICENPVTGGRYVGGADPIKPQKLDACRALRAREWFAAHGPQAVQPLPISDEEIEDRKYVWSCVQPSLSYIVSCFAYSLRAHDWDFTTHPSFEEFARGVLASDYAQSFVKEDEALQKRYPPRRLPHLNNGHCWNPTQSPASLIWQQGRTHHGGVHRKADHRPDGGSGAEGRSLAAAAGATARAGRRRWHRAGNHTGAARHPGGSTAQPAGRNLPASVQADGRARMDACEVRGITRGSYLEQVRGYARQTRAEPRLQPAQNKFRGKS